MSQKTEKAVNNYKNGYTCAQAVACAFCEEAGIDEKTMFRLTEAQGVGLAEWKDTAEPYQEQRQFSEQ